MVSTHPATTQERAEVFISYRRADAESARGLYRRLQERKVEAWYDVLITPGTDWRDAIVEHLAKARVMVILLSAEALESEELKKELAVADQEDVLLLTARLEDVKPREAFAYELARGNWFDLFEDPESRLDELAVFIEDLIRNPAEIPKKLEASMRARRRRRGPLALRLLRNGLFLSGLFALVTAVEFLLYEQMEGPMARLTEGGVGPLTAFGYVLFAVTVGSPLLFFSGLRGGVELGEVPLLVASALNSALLILLARHAIVLARRRFFARRSSDV